MRNGMKIIIPAVLVLGVIVVVFTFSTSSKPIELGMPVKCQYGQECFIQNYVDIDPSSQWQDYRCGALSYDGHKGTDFRVRDLMDMQKGFQVLAAANGTVLRVRDGMPDVNIKENGAALVDGKECGNGLVVDHGDGWETQYCHMRQGSLRVKEGEVVAKGQPIGQIGLSGNTEFPHLHISVKHEGKVVDPFMGEITAEGCRNPSVSLWDKEMESLLAYISPSILNSYFTANVPKAEDARLGKDRAATLPVNAPMLVAWSDIINVAKGDQLYMDIIDPEGKKLVEKNKLFEKNQAQYFQYIGKRLTESYWPVGTYTASTQLIRNNKVAASHTTQIKVE